MSSIRERSAELLKEFKDICNDRGYKYYLAPLTAACAYLYKGFGDNFRVPSVAMPFDDAMKFKQYIESGAVQHRTVESMESNPQYSTFSMSYVNEDTTMIEVLRGDDYQNLGVRISIELLRPVTKDKSLRRWETLWECTGYQRVLSVKHQSLNKPSRDLADFLRKSGKTKRLYRQMCKTYSGVKSDKYLLKLYSIKPAIMSKQLFEQTSDIEFEGEQYVVPQDVEKYLQASTHGTWKTQLETPSISTRLFAFYDNTPYKEADEGLRQEGKSIESYLVDTKKWYSQSKEIVKFNAEKKRLWDIAQRSGTRAIVYHELSKRIEEIRDLYQAGKFAELEEIFAEYDKEMHRFLNLGMGLCPSKELMDIECELLKRRGEDKIVEKLLTLTPAAHYEPVTGRTE